MGVLFVYEHHAVREDPEANKDHVGLVEFREQQRNVALKDHLAYAALEARKGQPVRKDRKDRKDPRVLRVCVAPLGRWVRLDQSAFLM